MRTLFTNWRMLIAVGIFGTVAFATTGATGLLSATDSVDGHVLAAVDTYVIDARIVDSKPFDVSGLYPGDSFGPGVVDLFNQNARPQLQYMYVENLGGDAGYCDDVYLSLSWFDGSNYHFLWEGALNDLVGEANMVQVNRPAPVALPAGWTTRLVQEGWIDAGSTEIGATCTWDEIFYGEQFVPAP